MSWSEEILRLYELVHDLRDHAAATELELAEMRDPTPPGCVRFLINGPGSNVDEEAEIRRFAKREGLSFMDAANDEAACRAYMGDGWEDE